MPQICLESEENLYYVNKFLKWKETGDTKIRNELLIELKPAFEASVRKIINRGSNIKNKSKSSAQDLLQEAYLGAIKGFEKFDPAKSPFVYYMRLWAEAYILNDLRKSFFIRIGTTEEKRKAIVALSRDAFKYLDKDGKEDLDVLSAISKIDKEILENVKEALQSKMISSDEETSSEVIDNWFAKSTTVSAYNIGRTSPEELLTAKQQVDLLYKVRDLQLQDFESKIKEDRRSLYKDLLNLRILPSDTPMTLEDIATKNNYKFKQNVAPVEEKIISSMKKKYLQLANENR